MRVFKKISIIFGAILLMVSSLSAEVSSTEKAALVALYDSTNGDYWDDNTSWNTGDPCEDMWFGVNCSEDNGSIIGLDLYANQLTGSIPSEIGGLINLEYLYLDQNQLTGSIPSEIGSLTNLIELYLAENQLTGSIPSEIGSLTNLEIFDLNENELTGSIPLEIGDLINLEYLYLDQNQLTGSIPSEIGSLTNLIELYLAENQLAGSIPSDIVALENLTVLYLASNCNLYSDNSAVQEFIDGVEEGDTYQEILDTNTHDCDKSNPVLAPIIMYLLN